MRRFVLAALALTSIAACQPGAELTDHQKAEIAAEVNLVLDQFWDIWRQVDYDQGIAYWEESPEMTFAGTNGETVIGFETLERLYQPFFATLSSQEFNFDETHIKVLSRDAVHTMQRGTYAQTDTAGVTGPALPLAYSIVWIRTEAGWKVTAAHMSQGEPAT